MKLMLRDEAYETQTSLDLVSGICDQCQLGTALNKASILGDIACLE
jgi:hypothetical protein